MPIILPHFSIRNYLIVLLTVVVLVINAAGLYLYRKGDDIDTAERAVRHTQEVLDAGLDLNDHLQSAVIAQRGYLITLRYSYLENFRRSLQQVDATLARLTQLTADNQAQAGRLETLKSAIDEKRAKLVSQLEARQRGAGVANVLTIPNQRQGLVLLQRIRNLHRDFLRHEQQLMQDNIAERNRQEDRYLGTVTMSAGLALLLLVAANGLIFFAASRQRRVESDLSMTRAELEAANERLELALRGTSDGVFDWLVEEDRIYLSPRYKAMLGYDEDELPDGMWAVKERLLHPDDLPPTLERLRTYIAGGSPEYRVTYRMRHKDGSWRWILSRAIGLFGPDGKATRLVGAHTDITEMKQLEESLVASNRELEGFTYIASHDLRSPLVNLRGFAGELRRATELLTPFVLSALKKKPAPANAEEIRYAIEEDIPEALGFLNSSVERMDRLTTAILQLSRIGRRDLHLERLDVEEIAQRCLGTLQHVIGEKNVEVEVQPLPTAWADAVSLEQVIGNILDNALKYLDPARPGRITIGGDAEGAVNRYFIADNGRGIGEADRQRVFEIFRRAGNNDAIPGEGMGMPYVRAMLRRHGGDITFTSEPGKGTVFTFTLPNEPRRTPDA